MMRVMQRRNGNVEAWNHGKVAGVGNMGRALRILKTGSLSS